MVLPVHEGAVPTALPESVATCTGEPLDSESTMTAASRLPEPVGGVLVPPLNDTLSDVGVAPLAATVPTPSMAPAAFVNVTMSLALAGSNP